VGYYDAQPFGQDHHLGSDWNGEGGGATDLGDPVTAAASGVVSYAANAGIGWGNVVILTHLLGPGEAVESLYGHLDRVDVRVGQSVARGAVIGTIGDADGRYVPHLHFELRTTPGLGVGGGYAASTEGWADPTAFVLAHRPASR
jgi:septal ring factor EnvC (AmiA/AmiB activator)